MRPVVAIPPTSRHLMAWDRATSLRPARVVVQVIPASRRRLLHQAETAAADLGARVPASANGKAGPRAAAGGERQWAVKPGVAARRPRPRPRSAPAIARSRNADRTTRRPRRPLRLVRNTAKIERPRAPQPPWPLAVNANSRGMGPAGMWSSTIANRVFVVSRRASPATIAKPSGPAATKRPQPPRQQQPRRRPPQPPPRRLCPLAHR